MMPDPTPSPPVDLLEERQRRFWAQRDANLDAAAELRARALHPAGKRRPLIGRTQRTLTAGQWEAAAQNADSRAQHFRRLADGVRAEAEQMPHQLLFDSAWDVAAALDEVGALCEREGRRWRDLSADAAAHEDGA